VAQLLEKKVAERRASEIGEFRQRREEGYGVALGPADVLAHAKEGRLERVYLDPEDPVMGSECVSCGTLRAGVESACGSCGGAARPVSLTQAVVSHAMMHPPLAMTFVPRPAPWLKELGGMAGLLAHKANRRGR
jgi:hypothetical protein